MNTKTALVERSAQQIIFDEFMIARAKIVELAATLDRIERATGDVEDSRNMQLLVQGMHIQLLMSRQYDPQWQTQMSISKLGS